MTTDSTPRIGIVGLGSMGTKHASNAVDNGGDIVAGADVVPDAREAFADAFDAATFADHEEMYDAVEPDGIVITTPNKFHEPAATAALDRDIDVLCEKPLAHELDAAERIAAAADAADAFCMVGFSNRFCGAVELYRAYRDRGLFGDVEHVEAAYLRRRGIPGVGSWFTDKELAGGGALIDIGVHVIDYALYLAGYPDVVEVSGVTRASFGTQAEYADPDGWAGHWDTDGDEFDVDDSATALLRCADGTTISVEVAWATNREPTRAVHVRGTDAGAKLDLGGDELEIYDAATDGIDHYDDRTLSGEYPGAKWEAEMIRYLEAVREGERPTLNTIEEGVTVQRVIDAIYRSSEAGSAIRLD